MLSPRSQAFANLRISFKESKECADPSLKKTLPSHLRLRSEKNCQLHMKCRAVSFFLHIDCMWLKSPHQCGSSDPGFLDKDSRLRAGIKISLFGRGIPAISKADSGPTIVAADLWLARLSASLLPAMSSARSTKFQQQLLATPFNILLFTAHIVPRISPW